MRNVLIVSGILFLAGPRAGGTAPGHAASAAQPTGSVEVDMRNVDLHLTDDVTLRVHALRGRFVPTRPGAPPNLDLKESYVVEVDAGETAIDQAALNTLMNKYVFGDEKAPIKDLDIKVEDGLVKEKGKLDKKIDIPFKVKGAVDVTPDGKLRIHAKSVKSLGLPIKPLMKLFGIEMDDIVKMPPGHGVTVDDNDFIIDPQQMMPPPRMRGHITAVRIEGDEIVQTFGTAAPPPLVAGLSRNHIYWRRGTLRFGKLTMRDTDLELIDQDPSDPFDFSAPRYNDMLIAGYSKNTPRLGLKTYLPDYDDLKAGRRVAGTPGAAAKRASLRRSSP